MALTEQDRAELQELIKQEGWKWADQTYFRLPPDDDAIAITRVAGYFQEFIKERGMTQDALPSMMLGYFTLRDRGLAAGQFHPGLFTGRLKQVEQR